MFTTSSIHVRSVDTKTKPNRGDVEEEKAAFNPALVNQAADGLFVTEEDKDHDGQEDE